MLAKLVSLTLGGKQYFLPSGSANKGGELLIKSGAYYRKFRSSEGGLTFFLKLHDCRGVEEIFRRNGVEFMVVRERGALRLIRKYRRRYGIIIGFIIFAAVILLSEQFVWNIKVSGNGVVPSDVIEERLVELGCGVGSYIPSLDIYRIQNEYLINYPDTAFIAVNLHGTVANVEVIEAELPGAAPDENAPHNLVAAEDGVVEYMEILRGEPVAREGELVREGELLASGIEEGKHGFSLVHARGQVLAEVQRHLRIEVPLRETVTAPTGAIYREKYLNFFGISIKFSESGGKMPEQYDKIESMSKVYAFSSVELPLSVEEVEYHELAPVLVSYTEESARAEAYRRFREECEKVLEGAELSSREIRAGLINDTYVIEGELTVICDIAKKVPITKGE